MVISTSYISNRSSHGRHVAVGAAFFWMAAPFSHGFLPTSTTTTTTTRGGIKRSLPVREHNSNNNNNINLPRKWDDASSPQPPPPHPEQFLSANIETNSPLVNFMVDDSALVSTILADVTVDDYSNSILPPTSGVDDLSKERLLNSISRTRPEDVLGADVKRALATGNVPSGVVADSTIGREDLNISNDNLTSLSSLFDNEDVQAVLSISEQAAAEAEASLSAELVEQLKRSTASYGSSSNATTITLSDEIELGVSPSITLVKEVALPEIVVPPSKVIGEPVTKSIEAPDVKKILKFAIPAIGVWLCGPLLSLIDTSAVGVFSGTVQQAALNPAVAVTDYAALLIAFMYTGTTNMVAAAQESDRGTVDMPRTAKTMIGAMQMSTFVGTTLGLVLFVFARPLLRAIIGNDAINPAVFDAAMKYVRIRALGMPAAAVIGSTQAACLGMQDIRSPLYVLVAAAVVNFFGDVLFVGNTHPLIGGAAGAAWATVISQFVAVAYFVRWLRNKPEKESPAVPQVLNVSENILKMTGKVGEQVASSGKQSLRDVLKTLKMTNRRRKLQARLEKFANERKEKKFGRYMFKLFGSRKSVAPVSATHAAISVRGFLHNRFSVRDFFKIPDQETRREFAPYVLPVTTTQVGRVSGYVAMSHVVASSLGTLSMAAQQIIVSIFYCLCPVADSLNLTAQSLVPGISERKASVEKAKAMKKVWMSFLKAGTVFGALLMVAVSGIPLLSGFFTSDPAVISLVNSVVPLLLVFFGIHGFVCGSEGLLLAQKDLGFLGKMYAIFFAAVPFLMMRAKRAALSGSHDVTLRSIWKIFVGYQVFRCGVWLVRLAQLQRRTNTAAVATDKATISEAIAP